jgi:hypothetical protein
MVGPVRGEATAEFLSGTALGVPLNNGENLT